MKTPLEREILDLKKKHNAIILAHYYETGDVQDIADSIGDSLFLAQEGQKAKNPVVLLAGVVFMAESVKLLSPEKKVLVPDLGAGCSLVQSSPAAAFQKWREQHPSAISVTYVNCSADVKALSDVICTSSNAEKIIRSIPVNRQILFAPDYNLGHYLLRKTGKDMILWNGSCEVHVLFSAKNLFNLKSDYPDAVVVAHPECDPGVLAYAEVIGSTSRLLEEVKTNAAKTFIVATEDGIIHQMKKARPDAVFLQAPTETDPACGCNQCPYMKLNTLEKIRNALRDLGPEVTIRASIRERAKLSLERMMAITENRPVIWPERFIPLQIS